MTKVNLVRLSLIAFSFLAALACSKNEVPNGTDSEIDQPQFSTSSATKIFIICGGDTVWMDDAKIASFWNSVLEENLTYVGIGIVTALDENDDEHHFVSGAANDSVSVSTALTLFYDGRLARFDGGFTCTCTGCSGGGGCDSRILNNSECYCTSCDILSDCNKSSTTTSDPCLHVL